MANPRSHPIRGEQEAASPSQTPAASAGAPGRAVRSRTQPAGGSQQSGVNESAGVRVRMYRVGFGDFFLVTFRGSNGTPNHVLIDCGVFAADQHSIGAAIDNMANETGGDLALVIMTHRHADHISGFALRKERFAGFNVERVWMPWFEDDHNDQAVRLQASLTEIASGLAARFSASGADDELKDMVGNITGDVALGGASNAVALETLKSGFKNGAPVDYYKAGDEATLPQSLRAIGLSAEILGPPGPEQLDLVAQMDNSKYEYLAAFSNDETKPNRIADRFKGEENDYPRGAFELLDARAIERAIEKAKPDVAEALAQKADNTLNNQSLVILFTFNGKKLLFVGDAQWGNWDNFLFDGAVVDDDSQLTRKSKAILQSLDFYKVGHHGSRNATPIPALENMREGFVAMCSTQPGAYGSEQRETEVPRTKLLDAIKEKTDNQLARSDQVELRNIPPDQRPDGDKGADCNEPLPEIFRANADHGYIDYEL